MRVASIISLIAVGLLSSVAVSLPIPSEHTSQYRASKTPVYQQNTEISIDEIELISSSVKNVAVPATADTVALSYIRNMTKHAWDSYSKYGKIYVRKYPPYFS